MNELDVLKFWEDNEIFKKSLENRKNNEPFVMYEGPPTANGVPGIHHVLTRTYKDIIARLQTMQGKYVERRAGWDEHGLPVEIEVQKQNNLNSKSDIESFGVDKFNELCAISTKKYIKDWEFLTKRMGYWLDFDNAYRTSSDQYIEKVWDILHILLDKGFIYKSYKVVPWAWDSETVLSNNEVSLGYKEVKHTSAYVLFHLENNEYLMAWTTTPWTLPANMALAVNPELIYNIYSYQSKKIISLNCDDLEVIGTISGQDLVGKTYKSLFNQEKYEVLSGSFVKNEKTGIVHIAPAFGQDDYEIYKKDNIICHLDANGVFNDKSILKGLSFKDTKKVNNITIKYLKENIYKTEDYVHQYPHNWRTGEPLVYFLRPSYYVNVNKVRDQLIEVNQTINWFPEHIKDGRFGEWLKGNVDWAISRERYWATPLPFTGNLEFKKPNGYHKPEADVKEVLDCWFDSGSMPFAAFDEYKQADVICEAIDQTRGWFYSLLVIGTILKGESPYKNVLCLGHVLDKEGKKMSKTKGNSVNPLVLFEKYGADAVRLYMVKNSVGSSILFNEKDLHSQLIAKILNCLNYLKTYEKSENKVECLTDEWILAKLGELTNKCINNYENYDIHLVVSDISLFVEDLSNIWIRGNRYRFADEEDSVAFEVLHKCLKQLSLLLAPITPFLSEKVWQELGQDSSVHLQDFPVNQEYNADILKEMDIVLDLVNQVRNIRNEAKIKVQQVLNSVTLPFRIRFEDFIKRELNVNNVYYGEKLELDIVLTEDLENEGLLRTFIRKIQVMRKNMNLCYKDKINLKFKCQDKFKLLLTKENLSKLNIEKLEEFDEEGGEEVKVNNDIRVIVKVEKC